MWLGAHFNHFIHPKVKTKLHLHPPPPSIRYLTRRHWQKESCKGLFWCKNSQCSVVWHICSYFSPFPAQQQLQTNPHPHPMVVTGWDPYTQKSTDKSRDSLMYMQSFMAVSVVVFKLWVKVWNPLDLSFFLLWKVKFLQALRSIILRITANVAASVLHT